MTKLKTKRNLPIFMTHTQNVFYKNNPLRPITWLNLTTLLIEIGLVTFLKKVQNFSETLLLKLRLKEILLKIMYFAW